jgi:hypothetical protein
MDTIRPLAPVIPIRASFQARRAVPAQLPGTALPTLEDLPITLIPQLPLLSDIGVVSAPPTGVVMVSGLGVDLDEKNRVLPLYTPSQARLIAERYLAAARAAECASCCSGLKSEVVHTPRPVCAACELGAVGE